MPYPNDWWHKEAKPPLPVEQERYRLATLLRGTTPAACCAATSNDMDAAAELLKYDGQMAAANLAIARELGGQMARLHATMDRIEQDRLRIEQDKPKPSRLLWAGQGSLWTLGLYAVLKLWGLA